MDRNVAATIASAAEHAKAEVGSILDATDPDTIWHLTNAAMSRLAYIHELLQDAGHVAPQ